MADTTILGLFEEIDTAAQGVDRLRKEAHMNWRDLMVMSSVPFPEGVLQPDKSTTRLPIFTVLFAFAGIAIGILLAGGTALLYEIPQGGKPIVPGPPTAIIAYEMMMLFALTGVFFRALYEIRLPGQQVKVYDERISEGMIGIASHCSSAAQATLVERILREAGAADIRHDARRFE